MDVMKLFNRKSLKSNLLSFLFYYLVTCLICSFITLVPSFISAIVQPAHPTQVIEVIVIYLFLFLSLSWIYVILVVACILI